MSNTGPSRVHPKRESSDTIFLCTRRIRYVRPNLQSHRQSGDDIGVNVGLVEISYLSKRENRTCKRKMYRISFAFDRDKSEVLRSY